MLQVLKQAALALLLVAICLGVSYAAVQSRATKAGGSTDYTSGQTITAAEVNADFNTLYTLQDGNIDTANINAAAGIVSGQIANGTLLNADVNAAAAILASKLDQTAGLLDADIVGDYSTDDAEQATTSDPGTSDSTTKATNLEEELAQLRFKLHELTVGSSASAVAAAGGTAALTSWIDGPIRGGNLIYNGGFDSILTLAAGADGDGWTRVLTADPIAKEGLVEAEKYGDGNGINFVANGAANEGIQQTLDGLKATAKYLAIMAVRDDIGTCSIGTSGADTNELTVVSDDTGNWQVLSGTFQTDAVPTDVDIQLLAVADGDDCVVTFVGVFEIGTNPLPAGGVIITVDTTTTTAALNNAALAAVPDLSIDMTPPMPSCIIEVDTAIVWSQTGAEEPIVVCAIDEEGVTKTRARMGVQVNGDVLNEAFGTFNLHYVNVSPTAGTDYTYTVECMDQVAGTAAQDAVFGCNPETCALWVKMTCPTR